MIEMRIINAADLIVDPLSTAGFKDTSISELKVNGISSDANIKKGINIGDLEPGAKVIVTFNVKLANDTLKNSNEMKNIASASDSTGKKLMLKVP